MSPYHPKRASQSRQSPQGQPSESRPKPPALPKVPLSNSHRRTSDSRPKPVSSYAATPKVPDPTPPRFNKYIKADRPNPPNIGQPTASQPVRSRPRPASARPSVRSPEPVIAQPGIATAGLEPDIVVAPPLEEPPRTNPLSWFRWIASWQFLLLTTLALVSGAGAFAVISLFRIPNLPNCRAIFWPTASASLRLQCAESYAEQGTVDFYLEAIDLVDYLPTDHPLRADINARIEEWSRAILDLAEESFDTGELDVAIATARKIPASTAAADLVEGRIRKWQRIWNDASDIYEVSKRNLAELKFQEAFSLAVQLLDVPNDHWRKTKYNELTKLIGLAREDSGKITKAKQLIKRGTTTGFEEAMELLASISEESVIYETAQTLQKEMAGDMLKVAESALQRQQLSQAERILKLIPRDAGFNQEVADFQVFVDAYQRAWSGDALGLDAAITRLQSIGRDRPLHDRAQALIGRWRSELVALAKLDQARQTAAGGTTADLISAINQAEQISRSNPRWDETSRQIGRWRERLQTIEDQPILSRADQLATPGTPDALRAAIQEAGKIPSDRALHAQASSRIGTWRRRLQQIEDQPVLEQARQQARSGDLNGAIATASRINAGRALYDEAQTDVSNWQQQNQTGTWLTQADQSAASGTASGLGNAIAIARQVPQSSNRYGDADRRINRWSWALLSQAENIARTDPGRAVALAQQIPTQSEAYSSAQARIREWQAVQTAPTPAQLELVPAEPDNITDPAPAPSPIEGRSTEPDEE